MKKLFVLCIFVICMFAALIAGCSNPLSTENNSVDVGVMLDKAYDSLKLTNPTLKDFRSNPELNADVTLVDIPGANEEGQTTIKFKGAVIFSNTWGYPIDFTHRIKTVVKHGYSTSGKYFIYVYNESVGRMEYRLFQISSGGQLKEITSLFKSYIFGIQEYDGKYLISSSDFGPHASGSSFISLMDDSGKVTEYKLPKNTP